MSNYACGKGPWHATFRDYVASRDYYLHTVEEYAHIARQAGFHSVTADDSTELFIDLLVADIYTIDTLVIVENVNQSFNLSWRSKFERARGGDHRWLTVSTQANTRLAG